jgi:hypothetical protein
MEEVYESEIRELRFEVISALIKKDYLNFKEGIDRLSVLYMRQDEFYSEAIEKEESVEKKEKLRVTLASLMGDWRTMNTMAEAINGLTNR